jgi:hypothetical protein
VFEKHSFAIATLWPGKEHDPGSGRKDRRSDLGPQVLTAVDISISKTAMHLGVRTDWRQRRPMGPTTLAIACGDQIGPWIVEAGRDELICLFVGDHPCAL